MKVTIKTHIVCVFVVSFFFACTVFAHDESAKFFPSDANDGDSFGASVVIDGNIAVVAALMNDSNGLDCGAVYIYELSGSQWLKMQKLVPSDGAASDKFGKSIAIEGNTIVVGSYYDDIKGSAYVFTRLNSVWIQRQKLVDPEAATGDRFGSAVAIDNNTIVIGNYGDDGQRGSASVFTLIGSTWTFQQKLIASDRLAGDFFGSSAAIDNNTIIIGAHAGDYAGYDGVGSAYLYQLEGTAWVERHIFRASDYGPIHHFGYSVALDSNYAVIGAYEGNSDIVAGAGAAYVFEKTGSNWVERQKLFDTNDAFNGEDFGWSVTIKNDTILVGCPGDYIDGNQPGSVFEFVRTGTTWVQNDRLTATDGNTEDKFGNSAAISGRNIIIGSPFSVNNGKATGSAYIFNEADVVAGDLDGDSDVDFSDFAVLGGSWRQNNSIADIAPAPAGDGIVDLMDLSILCGNWLAGR